MTRIKFRCAWHNCCKVRSKSYFPFFILSYNPYILISCDNLGSRW